MELFVNTCFMANSPVELMGTFEHNQPNRALNAADLHLFHSFIPLLVVAHPKDHDKRSW